MRVRARMGKIATEPSGCASRDVTAPPPTLARGLLMWRTRVRLDGGPPPCAHPCRKYPTLPSTTRGVKAAKEREACLVVIAQARQASRHCDLCLKESDPRYLPNPEARLRSRGSRGCLTTVSCHQGAMLHALEPPSSWAGGWCRASIYIYRKSAPDQQAKKWKVFIF